MKSKFRDSHKNRIGFAGRAFLTLVLTFGLLCGAVLSSNAAEEKPDLNGTCTLTVNIPESEVSLEELQEAGVVVDLYKVADVEPYESWYVFKACGPFSALKIGTNMNADAWQELSQKAAGIALQGYGGGKAEPEGAAIGTRVDLKAGLYLLAARGRETKEYVNRNEGGDIVTKAVSDECTYTFSPVLVALPGKELSGDDAQPSEKWVNDVKVVLKMKREESTKYGSIKIVKTLQGFSTGSDPAIFVFQVEAVLGGKKVYSNVVTLVFDKEGKKELLVENIPVGAKVTVTEVYSGACYSLVTDQTKTVTIDAEEIVPAVDFTNRYDERENGGHGITNHFTYEAGEWKLEQLLDKSQG